MISSHVLMENLPLVKLKEMSFGFFFWRKLGQRYIIPMRELRLVSQRMYLEI
jgi:hypothetical protein